MRTSLSRTWKAAGVLVVGLIALHLTSKRVDAAILDGGCIRACCFCVQDTGGYCQSGGLDFNCYSYGCGPMVTCGGSDSCQAGYVQLECQDPN